MKYSVITVMLFLCLAFAGCTVDQQTTADDIASGAQDLLASNPQMVQTAITLFPRASYVVGGVLAVATGWQKFRRTVEGGELKTALIDSNTPGAIAEPTRALLKKVGVNDPIVSNAPAGASTC